MANRTRPFDTFGPYILFKKLEEHRLGDLWRAGKIHANSIATVALHRLSGGHAEALRQAALHAQPTTSSITGTSIVRNQLIDVVDGIPIIEHEYKGGRSLRHVIAKARNGGTPHPIAPDQGLGIVDKVAAAVELVHNFRREGVRTVHGAVIPHFVWIEDDGEIRLAGQQIGKGLLSSLTVSGISSEIGGFIAPEVRSFGEPSAAGDIFALGGILHMVLTGNHPPEASNAAEFAHAMSQAVMMNKEPIPPEIRAILQRSLSPDINGRYSSVAEMRKELGALIHGGAYTATTFNLAFFLHSLLKKEFEGEAVERDKESKVPPSMYAVAASAAAQSPVSAASPRRGRAPLIAAAIALLAVAAFGAYVIVTRQRAEAKPAGAIAVQDSLPVVRVKPPRVNPTIVTVSTETVPTAIDPNAEAEERKKRIEDEVQRRLQEEMMKLQTEYDREVQRRRQTADAPPQVEPVLGRVAETQSAEPDPAITRAETQQSPPPVVLTATVPPPTATIPTTTQSVSPQQTQAAPAAAQAAAPAVPTGQTHTLEGDLIGFDQLDRIPRPLTSIRPIYPPVALRQRVDATVLITVLISETGEVLETKVLRGDTRRLGFDEAAIRAVSRTRFEPALKDGQRVRTWMPIPIRFQP